MRKKMMAAVCMAAVSLVFTGCGNGAKAVQDGSQAGQEREDTESLAALGEGEEAAGAAQDNKEKAEGAQGSEEAAVSAIDGERESEDSGSESAAAEFAGKTVSIFGDSISTFQGHNPEGYAVFFPEYGEVKAVEDTWWQQVVGDLELTLYQNDSNSGATVAGDSTGMEDPRCAVNELRTGALMGPEGICPDIIIVYLGTNDLLNGIPLGTNDGTVLVEEGEIETFSDAYSLMLDKLQAKYPPAEIYCCTLLPVGDFGTETPYVEFLNGDKLTAADYSEVIVKIAENRGHAVVDLQNCGVTVENLHQMTSDGVHPTADGMVCIAEAVKKTLMGQ